MTGTAISAPRSAVSRSSACGPPVELPIASSAGARAPAARVTAGAGRLAAHITALGALPCAEAKDRERLLPGRAYLAPGDRHLLIETTAGGLQARLSDAPPVNYCRPAVDPMLRSAAAAAEGRVLVAMLTGMGHDGLEGTRAVVAAGGTAIAQDEASSVVWGMPGAIAQAGLCHAVLPLGELAARLRALLRSGRP